MTLRRASGPLALALALSLGLAACASGGGDGGGGGQPEKQDSSDAAKMASNNPKDRSALDEGGTLTLPLQTITSQWNNYHVDGNDGESNTIHGATDPIFYNYAPDGTISPRTAFLKDMPKEEMKDGKQVVTYTLNEKAVWNDGTPIDHTAFEATWKVNKAPVDKGGYNNITTTGYENIESVAKGAAANEVVVTFQKDKPFHPITEVFNGVIHPKAAADPKTFNEAQRGGNFHPEWRSGPFTLDKLDTTAKTAVLKPNDKWWGEKPMLTKLVFRQMEDSATIPAFKNGEIDAVAVGNKARYAQIQGTPNMDIRRSQRLATVVFVFNAKADGLSDLNVRKAIWQAIDRDQWKKVRYDGLNWSEKPVNSAMYFSFQPEAEDNMPVKLSTEDAKKTLQGAGYTMGSDGYFAKGGKPLAVKYTDFGDDPIGAALAQTIQNQLKAAGVKMTLDIRPSSAFAEAFEKKDFGMVAMAWSSTSPSPVSGACQTMCSDSASNYSAVGTKELDARMRKVGSIADAKEQAKELNAIEKEWLKQYGQLPIANGPTISAYRKGVANLGPAAFAAIHPQWENVGFEKGTKKG